LRKKRVRRSQIIGEKEKLFGEIDREGRGEKERKRNRTKKSRSPPSWEEREKLKIEQLKKNNLVSADDKQ